MWENNWELEEKTNKIRRRNCTENQRMRKKNNGKLQREKSGEGEKAIEREKTKEKRDCKTQNENCPNIPTIITKPHHFQAEPANYITTHHRLLKAK